MSNLSNQIGPSVTNHNVTKKHYDIDKYRIMRIIMSLF